MIGVKIETEVLQRKLTRLEREQLPFALSLAINRTADIVKGAESDQIRDVFDRPTPFTQKATLLSRPANKRGPFTRDVFLRNEATKGTPPVKYLAPEVRGGSRRHKRYERVLQRAGILGASEFTVPGNGARLNVYGNMSAGQIVQILSVLKANTTSGFNANQTKRSKARNKKPREYFVARRGAVTSGGVSRWPRLPEGIWERYGAYGARVRPVLLFVDSASYTARFRFTPVAERVYREQFAHQFRAALRQAVGSAR